MLCSDEAWEIISTLAPCAATAAKVRAAMPGTPIIPRPATVTSASPRMTVSALTVPPFPAWATTRVPGKAGLKVLRTLIGMPRSMAGSIVLGCSTLAPK